MKDNYGVIRELRESKGLTLDDLAQELGVTKQAVSQYEKGKLGISVPALKQLCEFLAVDFDLISSRIKDESGSFYESKEIRESKATSDKWAAELVEELRTEINDLKRDKEKLFEMLQMAISGNGNFPGGYSSIMAVEHGENQPSSKTISLKVA